MLFISESLVTPGQICSHKITSKFLVLLIGLISISYAQVKAGRLDVHMTGINLSGFAMPGIGGGYDLRDLSSKSGWSCVPSIFIATVPTRYNLRDNKVEERTIIFFSTVVGRYRHKFDQQLSMDFNAGGALFGFSRFIPVLSANFNYTFKNEIMAGISLTDFTNIVDHSLLLSAVLSFPITNHTGSNK